MRSARLALTAALAFTLVGNSSIANASSSEVFDANDPLPAYVDIVHSKVTHQVGTDELLFLMELADAVPNPPVTSFVAYNYQMDTDPNTFPAPGQAFDLNIVIRWRGGQWEKLFFDFRPLLTGGSTIAIPIDDVTFDGATVKVRLSRGLLGDATGFSWRPLTRLVQSPGPIADAAAFTEFALKP
jgi:hypothetical protein